MRRIFRQDPGSLERAINRLDRLAGRINPFLMMVAIGLVILNVAALINLIDSKNLPITRMSPDAPAARPVNGVANPIPPS
jgi:hypothetical protein